ncbi:glycosyltransferase family 4 protein [Rhizobium rhizogenes]|uniref:glycosyltransferase family 4 protein n=1 Tax=Rhizobium rhizogenes TaxID=359 RepID=UPI00123B0C88|nr:glycosyltransferase family 4 protein [Rhizobium rhizogenes]KAA6485356.1 glycosyltransferase family 1 protein [Agrobacterium sp. ICMP 7243]NTF50131.1 glycosyltransferase family 4 protein [Rhizobium rhizogenes]NTF63147.1 glycosyltransferase family 4 protein [Rhizobium rhizogenes]NTG94480.1 glycosyltransferase family 4 protein [Rhizobium rhizogenes]NTH07513.1 glycosyltransferase family 4 protein [Rhizobium rhizogenes]
MTSAISDIQAQKPGGPLIVHVVRQFLPNKGGLEDVVANLCRQLIGRGYRVRVVTCNSLFSDPARELAPSETIGGIEIVRIPWSGSSRYPVAPKVFKHIADADLIHVHAVDFFFDALAWGKLFHGRPMVATTHGGFFHTPKFAAIKKLWFNTATRISALAYAELICCSQSDERLFSSIAGRRARLIENGADVAKFANCAALEARRRIVTIGRFSVNKRLDRMLDVMRVLADRDPDWHLDIIGAASDLDQPTLEQEIADRDLGRHVLLHVSIDNSAIRNIIARASLFASASEYEGFGLVAIEAMSAGLLPVLHTNDAYVALAETHPALMLSDFSDPQAAADTLTTAFERLETDGLDLREELIRDARAYAWDEVAERYIDAYAEAMTPKGQRHQPLPQRGQVA